VNQDRFDVSLGRQVPNRFQPLDGIGQLVELAKQSASTIETLGSLGIARTAYMP
jgi:hypothetical protein